MTKLPIIESYWVEENLFLAGEYPGSYNPEDSRKKLEAFIESGIRTFINLTQPHELVPYELILKDLAHIYEVLPTHHRFAIRDHGVPSAQTMGRILDTIDESISSGNPVYVHCWGGIGRTGTVVGWPLRRLCGASIPCTERARRVFTSLFRRKPRNNVISFLTGAKRLLPGINLSSDFAKDEIHYSLVRALRMDAGSC